MLIFQVIFIINLTNNGTKERLKAAPIFIL